MPLSCLGLCAVAYCKRPNRAVNADAPVRPFYLAHGSGGAPVTLYVGPLGRLRSMLLERSLGTLRLYWFGAATGTSALTR